MIGKKQKKQPEWDYILPQAFAYLFVGIFLINLTFTKTGQPYPPVQSVSQIFGIIFIGVSFFMLISQFSPKLTEWAKKLDSIFFSGLLVASLALLVAEWVKNHGSLLFYIIAIWFFLLLAAVIYQTVRQQRALSKLLGNPRASILTLLVFSLTFSLIGTLSIILGTTFLWGANLWLAFGLVAISIASIVEFQR
jgi:hypothetical protein